MTNKSKRIAVDAVLSVLLVAAMFVQLTGVILHEIIGAVFFALILVHLALSFKWMKASAKLAGKGKLRGQRIALMVMAALLAIDLVVLGASSVSISRILAGVGLAPALMSSFWKGIHTASSYILCGLTVVHLGMHWATLFSWMRVPYNPARRAAIGRGVNVVAAVGVVALAAQCANAMELFPESTTEVVRTRRTSPALDVDAPETSSSSASAPAASYQAETSASGKDDGGAAASASTPVAQDSGSTSQESAPTTQGQSTQVSGICTLCKKRCPLSAPQCDRPYLEGLLTR